MNILPATPKAAAAATVAASQPTTLAIHKYFKSQIQLNVTAQNRHAKYVNRKTKIEKV